MRKRVINCLFILTVIFTIAACSEPIFFTVSQEVKPIDPRIGGTPTNFAVLNGTMYVASGGTIHGYNGNRSWGTTYSPGGRISQIAATTGDLYALCFNDNGSVDSVIRKIIGGGWEVTGNYNSIYAAEDVLFIGAGNNTIMYYDGTGNTPTLIDDVSGDLIGACKVNSKYYVSTKNDGIFEITTLGSGATLINDGKNFMSMIKLNDNTIVLINRSGNIFTINNSIFLSTGLSLGSSYLATGALAVWKDNGDQLLLAGRQDRLESTVSSGYTYGYMELELDSSGIKVGANFKEPGTGSITTVSDNDRYKSTIGTNPVNHIFQAPDGILFASTQKNGVWSYRERIGSGYQWNAED